MTLIKGYQRILVPVDFSDSSEEAVRHAVGLATKFKARVRFLHVVQVMTSYLEGPVFTQELMNVYKEHERQARRELEKMKRLAVRGEAVVKRGIPVLEILSEAKKFNADLIIVGTHGRRGLDRLMVGSVAQEIMRKAQWPVLVVRPSARAHKFSR